jgi:hypothetical protein
MNSEQMKELFDIFTTIRDELLELFEDIDIRLSVIEERIKKIEQNNLYQWKEVGIIKRI